MNEFWNRTAPFQFDFQLVRFTLISCPAHMCLPARNHSVGQSQISWANEIVKCSVALSLHAAMNFASWVGYPNSVWVGVSQHVLNFSPSYTSPRKLTWITRLCFLVGEFGLGMRLVLVNEATTNQQSTLNIGIQLISMHICIHTPSTCCQQ